MVVGVGEAASGWSLARPTRAQCFTQMGGLISGARALKELEPAAGGGGNHVLKGKPVPVPPPPSHLGKGSKAK